MSLCRRGGVGRGLLEVQGDSRALAASAESGNRFWRLRPGAVGLTWKGFDMTGDDHLAVVPRKDAFGTRCGCAARHSLSWGLPGRPGVRSGRWRSTAAQVARAADRIRAGLAAEALANVASLTGMAARAVPGGS